LSEISGGTPFKPLDMDAHALIADWYHFAILELTEVEDFQPSFEWVAKRLAMSVEEVTQAVNRLVTMGLLVVTPDEWRQTEKDLQAGSGIASKTVREHHRQILRKAEASLEECPLAARDLSEITFGFEPDRMDEAIEEIKCFRRGFMERFESQSPKRIYSIAIQFFPLDRKEDPS
jgi:uncharacterized protein (TIGR02147 family)